MRRNNHPLTALGVPRVTNRVRLLSSGTGCTLRPASEVQLIKARHDGWNVPLNLCTDRAYCVGVVCSQLDRYVRPSPGGYDISAYDDDRVAIRGAEMMAAWPSHLLAALRRATANSPNAASRSEPGETM